MSITKPSIVFILPKFRSYKDRYEIQLAIQLAKIGFDMKLLIPSPNLIILRKNLRIKKLKIKDANLFFVKALYNIEFFNIPIVNDLEELISQIDPDIIHVFDHLQYSTYQILKRFENKGIGLVYSLERFNSEYFIHRVLNSLFLKLYFKRFVQKFNHLFTTQTVYYNFLRTQNLNKEEVSYLPPPVNDEIFEDGYPDNIDTPIKFLFIGDLTKNTGILQILEVFNKLLEHNSSIRLTIIGTGELKKLLISLVKKYQIGANIIFLDPVNKKRELNIISSNHLLIIPKNPSNTMNEEIIKALAKGRIVIYPRTHPLSVIIEKVGGIPIDYDKKTESINKLIEVSSDPQNLKKMSRTTYTNAKSVLRWSNVGRKVSKIYLSLIN